MNVLVFTKRGGLGPDMRRTKLAGQIERALLGAAMSTIALVTEWLLTRAMKRRTGGGGPANAPNKGERGVLSTWKRLHGAAMATFPRGVRVTLASPIRIPTPRSTLTN